MFDSVDDCSNTELQRFEDSLGSLATLEQVTDGLPVSKTVSDRKFQISTIDRSIAAVSIICSSDELCAVKQ